MEKPLGCARIYVKHKNGSASGLVLVMKMGGIHLLLGNDLLKQFKSVSINYEAKENQVTLGETPSVTNEPQLEIQIENLQSEKTVTATGEKILQNDPVLNDVNLQLSENKLTEMCRIPTKRTDSSSREREIDISFEISLKPSHVETDRSGSDRLKEGEIEANTQIQPNQEVKDTNEKGETIEEIKRIEQKDESNKDTERIEEINRFCVLLFLLRNQEIREPAEITKMVEQIIPESLPDEKGFSQNRKDLNLKESQVVNEKREGIQGILPEPIQLIIGIYNNPAKEFMKAIEAEETLMMETSLVIYHVKSEKMNNLPNDRGDSGTDDKMDSCQSRAQLRKEVRRPRTRHKAGYFCPVNYITRLNNQFKKTTIKFYSFLLQIIFL